MPNPNTSFLRLREVYLKLSFINFLINNKKQDFYDIYDVINELIMVKKLEISFKKRISVNYWKCKLSKIAAQERRKQFGKGNLSGGIVLLTRTKALTIQKFVVK